MSAVDHLHFLTRWNSQPTLVSSNKTSLTHNLRLLPPFPETKPEIPARRTVTTHLLTDSKRFPPLCNNAMQIKLCNKRVCAGEHKYKTTKPEYTDKGLANAANGASSQICARTHASSLQTNNHSKTKYCTRSRSPRKPTTTFLLGSWNRHLSCLSNCCLAMTCSAAKLWPLLLFRCSPQFPQFLLLLLFFLFFFFYLCHVPLWSTTPNVKMFK